MLHRLPAKRKSQRLLAIRPGGLGDCILSFPALESLRQRASYLEVWVPSPVVPLVRFADRVRSISSTGLDLVGLPGVDSPPELLQNFDAIVSWYGSNRQEFREATALLPIEFHKALPPPDSTLHAADFFATQLQAPIPATPHIKLDNQTKRNFIAIHPFSGSPRKNWPLDQFDALAQALSQPVEWCATAEQGLGPRAPALIANDLSQVARWLASARIYIGNDSGITHLAAAVGTPVIALFQASDPRLWAPRGTSITLLESATLESTVTAARQLFY